MTHCLTKMALLAANFILFSTQFNFDFTEANFQPDPNFQFKFVDEAAPIFDAPIIPSYEINSSTHGYALDFSGTSTKSQMQCIKSSGYDVVFLRGLSENGLFDKTLVENIKNAFSVGVGSEVFLIPNFNVSLDGNYQLENLYRSLQAYGITVKSIWLHVTHPSKWEALKSVQERISFISSFLKRAETFGLNVGIYTNFYDWNQITNNWSNVGPNVMLWYWHVLVDGIDGETDPDFIDFRQFGQWPKPIVKQFGTRQKLCGITVNRNVFAIKRRFETSTSLKLSVGSIGF